MKHLKVAGLCLVSMLVMSMTLAGNASAKPALLWLLCLEGSGLTKYEDNQCTKASGTGKWQSLGLPSGGSDTVRLLAFSLLLIDNGTGVKVHCPDAGVGWGLIQEGNKLVIKVAEIPHPEAEGCKLEKAFLTCNATSKLEKITAVGLPWTAELTETENKYLSTITKSASAPGWAVKCAGETDTCTEATKKPELAFVGQGVTKGVLLVLLEFESVVKANCSIGGIEKGEVKGLIAILLWNGNGLSFTTI
jgi:hypothetical protein